MGPDSALTRERIKQRFPAVLLTLLSIIQALAIEMLWSGLREHPHLWAGGLPAVTGWLQVGAVVLGIIIVWLFYTSLVMRMVWVPTTRDSIMPFLIGMAEFVLAQALAPAYLHLWLYLLAFLFVISTWTSSSTFMKARHDPENAAFFAEARSGPLETWGVPIAFVGTLGVAGLAVQIWGAGGLVGLGAVVAANGALVLQLLVLRSYWHGSLQGGANDAATALAPTPPTSRGDRGQERGATE